MNGTCCNILNENTFSILAFPPYVSQTPKKNEVCKESAQFWWLWEDNFEKSGQTRMSVKCVSKCEMKQSSLNMRLNTCLDILFLR